MVQKACAILGNGSRKRVKFFNLRHIPFQVLPKLNQEFRGFFLETLTVGLHLTAARRDRSEIL